MESIRMKLADMRKSEKNVRMHTEKQLKEYERSIRMFGQIRPIVVDEDGYILVGNGLYETLVRMNAEEADVYRMAGLTSAQKKKLMIADNKIFNLGVENLVTLNEFIEELKDDLDIPGFDEEILQQMVSDAEQVTEKICEYGTLDDDEIQEIKKIGERQNSMYGSQAPAGSESAAPARNDESQKPEEPGNQNSPDGSDVSMPDSEGKFVICPDCGRKIWL